MANQAEPPGPQYKLHIISAIVYELALGSLAVYFLVSTWPRGQPDISSNATKVVQFLGGAPVSINGEIYVLLVVVASAMIGTLIHATGAAVYHATNKTFDSSWLYWYATRPFVGAGLALVVYFAIRGGLLTVGTNVDTLNLFGVATVSALVGMFSREASMKLQSLADELFGRDQQPGRTNNKTPPVPP